MALPHTWSALLDDLVRMKIESDKGVVKQPMLGPFIERAKEQQLSLAIEKAKPNNLELVFGYCVACISVLREKQICHENAENFQEVSSLDQPSANTLNLFFDVLEMLAQKEVSGE